MTTAFIFGTVLFSIATLFEVRSLRREIEALGQRVAKLEGACSRAGVR